MDGARTDRDEYPFACTLEGGSAHTNAVLSGQAFGFIGGPEHDAFAKIKGAELRSVVNIVDRGNVYLVARKGLAPAAGQGAADFVRGKTIAVGFAGGTPNSITRYLAKQWKLEIGKDVKLMETTNAGTIAAVKAGQADIAVVTEPQITQGITQGLTGEPFFSTPKELGPYAYSTINIRYESMQKEPKTVENFVHALEKGLKATYANPAEAAEIAHKEFPTMSPADLKATIDRSFADQVWSHDGSISKASWTTAKSVVMAAGLLKQDVPYEAIIDTRYVLGASSQ